MAEKILMIMFVPFLAVICRGGTVYDPCSTPCPETCGDPPGGYNCTIEGCIENCRCPDDKVLDGDRCVDRSECGCTLDNGQYLPVSLSEYIFCCLYDLKQSMCLCCLFFSNLVNLGVFNKLKKWFPLYIGWCKIRK